MKATFIRKTKINGSDAYSFYFLPEKPVRFIAGQYTELNLRGIGKHWFTISSPPGQEELSLTSRLTGSVFKNALDSLKDGVTVDLAEPMGDFVLPVDNSIPILMVAGGIGITPFMSILSDCLNSNEKRNLRLLYAASSQQDFVDLYKYTKLLSSYKRLIGSLEAQTILNTASFLMTPYIYLSGPEPMVEALVKQISLAGFAESRLVVDYFPGYR